MDKLSTWLLESLSTPDLERLFSESRLPLSLNAYQAGALKTVIYPDKWKVIYPALGLGGEAGEFSGHVKKYFIRDGVGDLTEEEREVLKKELGDTLWYLALAAHDLGFTLEEVAQGNLDKLASRQKRGTLRGSGDNR